MRRFVVAIALLFALAPALPIAANAQVIGVNITIAPPELPVYAQPPLPAPGYIWIPGYWAYGPYGYYWVPGTWELPPAVGLLWTPGYWGWRDGFYAWHAGYWGPHVGFYGGVNYGFGYTGVGYLGGRWRGGVFAYNRAVNNFGSVRVTNVYNKTVINNVNVTRVSYNGGRGGLTARPTQQQQVAARERHIAPTSAQTQHQRMASTNKALLASQNHGRPPIAATARPTAFTGKGIVAAREPTPNSAAPLRGKAHPGGQNPTAAGTRPSAAAPAGRRSLQSRGVGAALPQNKEPAGRHAVTRLNGGVPRATAAKPSVVSRPPVTGVPAHPSPPPRAMAPHPPARHAAMAPHPMGAPHRPAQRRPGPHPQEKGHGE